MGNEAPDSSYDIESILFLLLYSEGPKGKIAEPLPSNLFAQKEVFVISQKVKPLGSEYQKFRLGPFSEMLDETLEQLRTSEFISSGGPISLSERGKIIAENLWQRTNPQLLQFVTEVKKFFNDMTKDELLAFIYTTYTNWTEYSDIREDVESKRVSSALSLFEKRKVSLGKAAAIAGLTTEEFAELARKHRIPVISYSDTELREELSGHGSNP